MHCNRREHETSGWLQYNREEPTTLQQTTARNIRMVTVQQRGTYNTTTDENTKHQGVYSTTERNVQRYNRREHETSGWLQYNSEEPTILQQ